MTCPQCESDVYEEEFFVPFVDSHQYHCSKCNITYISKRDWNKIKQEKQKEIVAKLLYSEMVND